MLRVTVEENTEDARRALDRLNFRQFNRVIVTALNATARETRTQTARSVSKAMGLKVGAVRRRVTAINANPNTLTARVTAKGRPLGLAEFKARQTRRGVSASAYGKRKTYKGTFLARLSTGLTGVFVRRGGGRYPVKYLYGPGIAQTLDRDDISEEITGHAQTRLQVNIARQIERALRS